MSDQAPSGPNRDRGQEIAEKIERAFSQFERGECFSPEASRAEMERRKSAWLANRQPC